MVYRRRRSRPAALQTMILLVAIVGACLVAFWIARKGPAATGDLRLDPVAVARAVGRPGNFDGRTFRVTLLRPGLGTSINGVSLTPEMGLEAWITLSGTRRRAVLLGDIPLREEEVNGALKATLDAGLVVTSLHNKFLMDSSRLMSLHVEGLGTQEELAAEMGRLLRALADDKLAAPRPPRFAQDPVLHSRLDRKTMESLLWEGTLSNGVFKVSVGRGTTLSGQILREDTGVNSWAAFAGSTESAVVNGDIATLEFELPYVLKDLLGAGIQVSSVHTHMTEERPRLIFVHFWGQGDLAKLAEGVKDAIWEKEHFQTQ